MAGAQLVASSTAAGQRGSLLYSLPCSLQLKEGYLLRKPLCYPTLVSRILWNVQGPENIAGSELGPALFVGRVRPGSVTSWQEVSWVLPCVDGTGESHGQSLLPAKEEEPDWGLDVMNISATHFRFLLWLFLQSCRSIIYFHNITWKLVRDAKVRLRSFESESAFSPHPREIYVHDKVWEALGCRISVLVITLALVREEKGFIHPVTALSWI